MVVLTDIENFLGTYNPKIAISTHGGTNWFWKFLSHTPQKLQLVHMVVLTDFDNSWDTHPQKLQLVHMVLTDFENFWDTHPPRVQLVHMVLTDFQKISDTHPRY